MDKEQTTKIEEITVSKQYLILDSAIGDINQSIKIIEDLRRLQDDNSALCIVYDTLLRKVRDGYLKMGLVKKEFDEETLNNTKGDEV